MDKLELDARVERLERQMRVFRGLLGAVVLAGFLLALMATRERVSHSASVATPASVAVETAEESPPMPMTGEPWTVPVLAEKLRELDELYNQSAITNLERDAKKQAYLQRPLALTDLKSDLLAVQELYSQSLVSNLERDQLKATVLRSAQ